MESEWGALSLWMWAPEERAWDVRVRPADEGVAVIGYSLTEYQVWGVGVQPRGKLHEGGHVVGWVIVPWWMVWGVSAVVTRWLWWRGRKARAGEGFLVTVGKGGTW